MIGSSTSKHWMIGSSTSIHMIVSSRTIHELLRIIHLSFCFWSMSTSSYRCSSDKSKIIATVSWSVFSDLPYIQPFTLLRVKDKNVGSNRKKLKRKEYLDNVVLAVIVLQDHRTPLPQKLSLPYFSKRGSPKERVL